MVLPDGGDPVQLGRVLDKALLFGKNPKKSDDDISTIPTYDIVAPRPKVYTSPEPIEGTNANAVCVCVCVWCFDVRFQGQTRAPNATNAAPSAAIVGARVHHAQPQPRNSRTRDHSRARRRRGMQTPAPWFSSPEPTRGRFVVPTHLCTLCTFLVPFEQRNI